MVIEYEDIIVDPPYNARDRQRLAVFGVTPIKRKKKKRKESKRQ